MFHVLHKVDMCVCYARRKINFSLPLQTTQTQSIPCLASFKNVFHLEQLFLINLCHAFAISIIYCRIFHFLKFFLIILIVSIYAIIVNCKKALTLIFCLTNCFFAQGLIYIVLIPSFA